MKVLPGILLLAWTLLCGAPRAHAADADRHVSIWIISAEGAGPNDIAQGEDLPARMEALRQSLAGTRVRLLNVEPPLAAKTGNWFPEYTVPNFQAVASQRVTFAALARFAAQNDADINLRIITWRESVELLRAARTAGPDALPDVMEVGRTWSGYLAASGRIRSRPDWQTSKGNWRDVLSVPACALPLITDVRLLFYWKRLPSAAPDSAPLSLDNSNWPRLLDSVRSGTSTGETIAFPIGNSLNLLYDYVSLAMAGGSPSVLHKDVFGTRLSLSSKNALSVPLYLAEHASVSSGKEEGRQLVSFPEATHEEEVRTFVNGGYLASVEPASFMTRWAYDFYGRQRTSEKAKRFWDYAAAVIPPANFLGGGEFVVLSRKPDPQIAFQLADFLANDAEYTAMLGKAGFLVSGKSDHGTDAVVASLVRAQEDTRDARAFGETVREAIDQGQGYPDSERWPMLEDPAVLDRLQGVFRRMADGDIAGMRQQVKQVDWAVNSQIYPPSRAWNALIQSWRWVALIFSVGTFLLVLAVMHRRRLRQMERQFDIRLEERLNERTRIARELHDTLLQSFQGAVFQAQAARKLILRKADNAMETLEEAIGAGQGAINEGRTAIQDLRPDSAAQHSLPELLNEVGREMANAPGRTGIAPNYRVLVEGGQPDLLPMLQHEIYRISREVIRNAFMHAAAAHIEVEIHYSHDQLRLRIRDDGKGIDPAIMAAGGRSGHFGIPGMRERAERIGAHLDFWSRQGAGTEVQLWIPASIAYKKQRENHSSRFFRKPGNEE
jgi:signal transduction histidine kinase